MVEKENLVFFFITTSCLHGLPAWLSLACNSPQCIPRDVIGELNRAVLAEGFSHACDGVETHETWLEGYKISLP